MTPESGWALYEDLDTGHLHVMPQGEEHAFCGCRCQPWKESPSIIVHRAFDRREMFEDPHRRPS
jgi:hypothetical protein